MLFVCVCFFAVVSASGGWLDFWAPPPPPGRHAGVVSSDQPSVNAVATELATSAATSAPPPQVHTMKVVDWTPPPPTKAVVPNRSKRKVLKPKHEPALMDQSGPPGLRDLEGQCFAFVEGSYEYEVCPFHNVTQHDIVAQWNPFSGVLGIWTSFVVRNHTFASMLFEHGDDCGRKTRQTEVVFECGAVNATSRASEPHTCEYQVVFQTPLACGEQLHVDALVGEPVLDQWRTLDAELDDDVLTPKGHTNQVHALLRAAGVLPAAISANTAKDQDKGGTPAVPAVLMASRPPSPAPSPAPTWNRPVWVSCETEKKTLEEKLGATTLQLQAADALNVVFRQHLQLENDTDLESFLTTFSASGAEAALAESNTSTTASTAIATTTTSYTMPTLKSAPSSADSVHRSSRRSRRRTP